MKNNLLVVHCFLAEWKAKIAETPRTKLMRHLLIKLISDKLEDHTLSGYGHLEKTKLLVEGQEQKITDFLTEICNISKADNRSGERKVEDQEEGDKENGKK